MGLVLADGVLILKVFLQTRHHVRGTTVWQVTVAAPAIAIALNIATFVLFVALVLGLAIAIHVPMFNGGGAV